MANLTEQSYMLYNINYFQISIIYVDQLCVLQLMLLKSNSPVGSFDQSLLTTFQIFASEATTPNPHYCLTLNLLEVCDYVQVVTACSSVWEHFGFVTGGPIKVASQILSNIFIYAYQNTYVNCWKYEMQYININQ